MDDTRRRLRRSRHFCIASSCIAEAAGSLCIAISEAWYSVTIGILTLCAAGYGFWTAGYSWRAEQDLYET